jgi:hypothetical protein
MREVRDCVRGARRIAWAAGGMFAMVLLVNSACFAATVVRPGFTLGQLMQSLAQRKHGEVPYTEEDYLAILDRPVKSSGVLVYEAPGHLEKRTLRPKRESLILEGDELTVERGRREYHMQLSAYPQVAPLVDAVRDTLAGDEQALQKVFEVELSGTQGDWKLELAPRDEELARKVRRVEIAGAGDEIRSVEILQVSGDRSVMTLGQPADTSGTGR